MAHYVVGGRTAATAATARVVAAAIWNPSSSKRLHVWAVGVASTTAGVSNLGLARTTARGTASTTVTPDIDNEVERVAAPPSGFLLDLAFSGQPTVDASDLHRWNLPAAVGAGVILPFRKPIEVAAGAGLALITPTAVVLPVSDVFFDVED